MSDIGNYFNAKCGVQSDYVCNFGKIEFEAPNSAYNSGNQSRYGDYYSNLEDYEIKDFDGRQINLTLDDLAVSLSILYCYSYYCIVGFE